MFPATAAHRNLIHYGNQGGTPGASVHDGDWKLIRFFEDGRGGQYEELYNLKEDIGETRNLAESEPGKRERLSAKLAAWQEEIEVLGAPLIPELNPEYGPREGREPSGHFWGGTIGPYRLRITIGE